jgi:membrane protein required for colicin V production
MNSIDIALGVILLYAGVRGFMRGAIKEIAGIVAIAAGVFLSIKFSGYTAQLLNEYFGVTGGMIKPAAFIVTFVLVLILVKLLAGITDKMLEFAGLGIFLKLGGTIISLLKWMLILGAVLIALVDFNSYVENSFIDEKPIKESILSKMCMGVAGLLLPDDVFVLQSSTQNKED